MGISYDDDDEFLKRVQSILKIVFVDTHIVLHQNHYSPNSTLCENRVNKYDLIRRNKSTFNNKCNIFSEYPVNLISKQLPLNIKYIGLLFL